EDAVGPDACGEPGVVSGIDDIDPAAEHGDRAGRPGEGALVAGRVDAGREAARDREAGSAQVLGQAKRRLAPRAGRVAAADDRDLRSAEEVGAGAVDPQRERRVVRLREARRELGRAVNNEGVTLALEPATHPV